MLIVLSSPSGLTHLGWGLLDLPPGLAWRTRSFPQKEGLVRILPENLLDETGINMALSSLGLLKFRFPLALADAMRTKYPLLLLFIFALFGAATAQSQLINLSPERGRHAATRLLSGKVLITGGVNEGTVLTSALLYDPASGIFTPTGSMMVPRENHTSTLLPDGRVLITGGDQSGVLLQSAETYNPVTGTFTMTPQGMRVARTQHTANLLNNGTVLIVGGKSADIFDPSQDSFTATIGSPNQYRKSHMATKLNDGTVLISGGYVGTISSDTAETYNEATDTFTAVPKP